MLVGPELSQSTLAEAHRQLADSGRVNAAFLGERAARRLDTACSACCSQWFGPGVGEEASLGAFQEYKARRCARTCAPAAPADVHQQRRLQGRPLLLVIPRADELEGSLLRDLLRWWHHYGGGKQPINLLVGLGSSTRALEM